MTMHRRAARRHLVAAVMLCTLGAGMTCAHAQDYPARPITLVVPFAAGSGTDQLTRALANAITQEFKVPVVVDVRPGANGFIAAQYVAKAAPDGYTALSTTNTTHAANEHLYNKLPYDPVKDFTPVILISKGHMALMVNPASNIKSVADLVVEAKKNPGKLSFGSGSSSSRVAGELLRQMAAIEVLHVPYKSNPQGVTDLIGGQVDFMFADSSVALPQINAGKLRALAVSGTRRMSSLPAVPTVAEAGIAGYDMSYWSAIYLPANVPVPVVKKLHDMVARASASPAMAAFQNAISAEVVGSTPEGLAAFQAAESQKWGRVIRGAGIVRE